MEETEKKNIIESLVLVAKEKYPELIKGNNLTINIRREDGGNVSYSIDNKDISSILFDKLFLQDREDVNINDIAITDNESGTKIIEISVR